MGNVRCNKYWEARLPRDFHRPPEADMGALRVYITDKYVNKRYALQGYSESPCIENYMSHPFVVELAGGGKSENGGAGETVKPAITAAAAVTKAAVPEFDLLSLHDDPVPAPVPQQQPQPPLAATASAPAQVTAAPAADWDPFAAIAREPVASSVPAPALIDPFAEIERTASSRSNATTASASSLRPSSSLGNNIDKDTNGVGTAALIDPFAMAPLPASFTTTTTTAPIATPPSAPTPTPTPAPSMTMTSSGSMGLAPMRSGSSVNGHSKGKVSHEDILAMFNK
jgi:hypothetical protein